MIRKEEIKGDKMKKKLIITTSTSVALLIIAIFMVGCTTNPTGNIIEQKEGSTTIKEPIKIGFISPMSGNAVAYGEYSRRAFDIGVEEYNSNHNQKIQVIYEDGKCSPTDAVNAANKLINIDHVNYLMTFCTGETNAVSPIAEANKIILLTSGTTGPNIKRGQYIFRNIGSVGTGLNDIAKLAIQKDSKIALISENTDYATSTKIDFEQKYKNNGGNVAFDESFDAKSADFRTIIAKLKNDNITTVFVVVQSLDNSATLFKEMKEMLLGKGYQPIFKDWQRV